MSGQASQPYSPPSGRAVGVSVGHASAAASCTYGPIVPGTTAIRSSGTAVGFCSTSWPSMKPPMADNSKEWTKDTVDY